MAITDNETALRDVVQRIEGAVDNRLNWLMDMAGDNQQIVNEINHLRRNFSDMQGTYDEVIVRLVRTVKESVKQRDDALMELDHIEHQMEDLDGATHPKLKRLAQKVIDMVNDRVEERAQQLLSDQYMEIMEDSVEYAEESVWDGIAELVGDVLNMTSFEGHDVLTLLAGTSSDYMNDELVNQFHEWLEDVSKFNREQRELRVRRNEGK